MLSYLDTGGVVAWLLTYAQVAPDPPQEKRRLNRSVTSKGHSTDPSRARGHREGSDGTGLPSPFTKA